MLGKKNKQINNRRRSNSNIGSDFRRNSVVISSKEREVAAHKQSVSQRQIDSKKRQQSKIAKRRIIIFTALALVVFLALRYQVTSYGIDSKSAVQLSDQQKLEYSSTMIQYSNSHAPLKQFWLLDKDGLSNDILETHPEVSGLELSPRQPFTTKVSAKLTFRKPIFVWKGVGENYFIDKEGVLFKKNMFTKTQQDSLPVIEDQGGVAPDPGQTVLTETVVSDVADLYLLLPTLYPQKNKVNQIILPPAAREIRAKLDGISYYVKFSTERSIGEQVGELAQLVNYLKSKDVTPAEYIDMRVPDKSFYK